MEEKTRGRGNTETQVKTGTFSLKNEDTTTFHLLLTSVLIFYRFYHTAVSHFHLLVSILSTFSLSKHTIYLFFFCFLSREKPPVKEARRPPTPPSWLQRDLKVRFIDKAFKGGRYYNSKVLTDMTFSLYQLLTTLKPPLGDRMLREFFEPLYLKRLNSPGLLPSYFYTFHSMMDICG